MKSTSHYLTTITFRLLGLVDDVELITKELIENAIAPKPKKMTASDHAEITQLLVQKDMELKGTTHQFNPRFIVGILNQIATPLSIHTLIYNFQRPWILHWNKEK